MRRMTGLLSKRFIVIAYGFLVGARNRVPVYGLNGVGVFVPGKLLSHP